jgi:hypothetical protein
MRTIAAVPTPAAAMLTGQAQRQNLLCSTSNILTPCLLCTRGGLQDTHAQAVPTTQSKLDVLMEMSRQFFLERSLSARHLIHFSS